MPPNNLILLWPKLFEGRVCLAGDVSNSSGDGFYKDYGHGEGAGKGCGMRNSHGVGDGQGAGRPSRQTGERGYYYYGGPDA